MLQTVCEVPEAIPPFVQVNPHVRRRGQNGRGAYPVVRYLDEWGMPQEIYLDMLPLRTVVTLPGTTSHIQIGYGYRRSALNGFAIEIYTMQLRRNAGFSRCLCREAVRCVFYRLVREDGKVASRWHRQVGATSSMFRRYAPVTPIASRTRGDRQERLIAIGYRSAESAKH